MILEPYSCRGASKNIIEFDLKNLTDVQKYIYYVFMVFVCEGIESGKQFSLLFCHDILAILHVEKPRYLLSVFERKCFGILFLIIPSGIATNSALKILPV